MSSINGGNSIKLPIPANIQDALSLNWEIQESAPLAELGAVLGGALPAGAKSTAEADPYNLPAAGLKAITDAGKSFSQAKLGQQFNAQNASQQALQLYGLAQNPALTVLFKHPHFKKHSFTWKLSPNNAQETQTITNIINNIKYNSRPGTTGFGAFFTYPSIAVITFSGATVGHLYTFQESVITDVIVHYAPVGVPAFHSSTSAPAIITLTVNFMEIILNTRENFNTNQPNNLIGHKDSSRKLGQLNKKNN